MPSKQLSCTPRASRGAAVTSFVNEETQIAAGLQDRRRKRPKHILKLKFACQHCLLTLHSFTARGWKALHHENLLCRPL